MIGGLRSDPAEGREAEEAIQTRRKVTRRAVSAGDLASGVGLDAGGATVCGGATAVGATGADAGGGPRSRGGEGGEDVGGPPEAGDAEARGRDAQSLSRCHPSQCAQLRIPGPMSLARVIDRFGAVVEATASARAVERGDGPGAAGLAGAGAADGRLGEDVAGARCAASCSCRTFSCRCRSASCVARAGVEARSAIEVRIRRSSALRRTDRSCSLSAHARSD